MSVSWEIREGDVLDRLREMPDGLVHCCITSPPYYGLRDYGTGTWEGGGDTCDHVKGELRLGVNLAGSPFSNRGGARKIAEVDKIQYGGTCEKCGAVRIDDQIGLEPTPEQFVEKLVAVFAEVKRVLRDDGTLWLNLGDSYARSAGPRLGNFGRSAKGVGIPENRDSRRSRDYAKSKDLLGIPWMVAFALRADGWYLRSEIIWHKPNPMPASVRDRPTVSHETVFLLAKSERYFYDAVAIREPDKGTDHPRTVLSGQPSLEPSGGLHRGHTGLRQPGGRDGAGANKRSVWTVATRPYREAHFATFPPKLVEPMVLAGCPARCCSSCAAPWARVTELVETGETKSVPAGWDTGSGRAHGAIHRHGRAPTPERAPVREPRTVGWQPTCAHTESTGGGLVLDPFAGSGTTLAVAIGFGRSALGIELNPAYAELARRRMGSVGAPLFAAEGAAA